MTPRVLFVGRTRYRLPLTETLQRRFDALSTQLDWRVLGSSLDGGAVDTVRFRLAPRFPVTRLDGVVFYVLLPARVIRELRSFRPDVVIVQGATDTAIVLFARFLARSRARVIFDVHGDWRHDTRLYGSPHRRLLAPLTDALAKLAVRRADGVRTISGFTSGLVRTHGVEPAAEFPAYMDLAPFTATPPAPLPASPVALFVGVLERYKGVDVLAEAWPVVARSLPGARLEIVGVGPLSEPVETLREALPETVGWTERMSTSEVAAALDAATVLVLPSRNEGMGRVVVEAFCRGRGVVGTRGGGIPDLVEDGVAGILVPVEDAGALAEALVRVLSDPVEAGRLGTGAAAAAGRWSATPEEFAKRVRALVDTVASR